MKFRFLAVLVSLFVFGSTWAKADDEPSIVVDPATATPVSAQLAQAQVFRADVEKAFRTLVDFQTSHPTSQYTNVVLKVVINGSAFGAALGIRNLASSIGAQQ